MPVAVLPGKESRVGRGQHGFAGRRFRELKRWLRMSTKVVKFYIFDAELDKNDQIVSKCT